MSLYKESDYEFFDNKVFAPIDIKEMDSDILSEDEQINDAHNFIIENLYETIKLAKVNKNYLVENVWIKPQIKHK